MSGNLGSLWDSAEDKEISLKLEGVSASPGNRIP